MNFIRMGDVNLDELELQPQCKCLDGSGISFSLLNPGVLERAHFYDAIGTARLNVYVTYVVEFNCVMRSGHTVKMYGQCTPHEYQRLLSIKVKTPK